MKAHGIFLQLALRFDPEIKLDSYGIGTALQGAEGVRFGAVSEL